MQVMTSHLGSWNPKPPISELDPNGITKVATWRIRAGYGFGFSIQTTKPYWGLVHTHFFAISWSRLSAGHKLRWRFSLVVHMRVVCTAPTVDLFHLFISCLLSFLPMNFNLNC